MSKQPLHVLASRAALLLAVSLVWLVPAGAAAQGAPDTSTLVQVLKENRRTLHMAAGGRLAGPGAAFLLDAGRDAQFFLVGEEHGIAEVPRLTAALFRALAPYGYRHLAVETGGAAAAAMNAALQADRPLTTLRAFLRRHWPGVPFYTNREEAELLLTAVEAAGGADDVLWGLDYDILGDRYALRRLRALAPDADARARADRVIAAADSMLETALAEANPARVFMFAGAPEAVAGLRKAYAPPPGSEADRILEQLEETLAINRLFASRRGWESNRRRAEWNRRQFLQRWRERAAEPETPPRVMFKFGATHLLRGRSFMEVYDIGNLASELAASLGSRSFGVMMVAGRGTETSQLDPRTFGYTPAPAQFAGAAWARPFYEAADPDCWTVFDLRPLRPLLAAGRLGEVHPWLRKVVFGYDAFLVLSGSTRSTQLELERP